MRSLRVSSQRRTQTNSPGASGQVVSSLKMLPEFCWDPHTVGYIVVVLKRVELEGRITECCLDWMVCPADSSSLFLSVSLFGLALLVVVNASCVFADSSQVFDIKVVNISATSLTLTWKINDHEPSSVYTYEIQVAGETDSFNLTVNETQAVLTPLRSSSLYNITVCPLLDGGSTGTPGFLQVYTRESTPALLTFHACLLCARP